MIKEEFRKRTAGKEHRSSKRNRRVPNVVSSATGIRTKIVMENPCVLRRTSLGQMTPTERERVSPNRSRKGRKLRREKDVIVLLLGRRHAEAAADGYGKTALCI